MNGLESTFVYQHRKIQKLARVAAETRKKLVEAYIAQHFPEVSFTVTIANDNALSLDVSFPGLTDKISLQIAQLVTAYLQDLLKQEVNDEKL